MKPVFVDYLKQFEDATQKKKDSILSRKQIIEQF